MGRGSEREASLIKNHVSRDDQAVCGKIKATIAFVFGRVAKEDTPGGPGTELIGSGGGGVRITRTARNPEVLVGRWRAKEGHVRTGRLNRLGGETIEEVCRGVKSLSPVAPRKMCLKEQSANDVIDGTNDTFGFTVLGGGIWTGHPKQGAFRQEKGPSGRVVKLAPVVTLDGRHGAAELCRDIGKEIGQSSECVRFKFKRKRPYVMSKIIENNQIILITRHTDNGGCPQIKMH
jgi:hypothetical protein